MWLLLTLILLLPGLIRLLLTCSSVAAAVVAGSYDLVTELGIAEPLLYCVVRV